MRTGTRSKQQEFKKVKEVSSGPGKVKDRISTSDKIQIFIAIITFISLIGVLLTLNGNGNRT